MERLTEKRDGQNVIPLRQSGKVKWSICSAGLGDAPTEYLYGDHADRLAAIEDILGDEYDMDRLRELVEADKTLKEFGRKGTIKRYHFCGDPSTLTFDNLYINQYLFPSIKPDREYTLDEIIGGAE